MARPAADLAARAAGASYLAMLLRTEPGRLGLALRLAVVCALTAAITAYYGTPEAALTLYIAFFLVKADRATSAILPVALTVLVTLVIALIFAIADRVVDAPAWRLFAMILCSLVLLWLGAASKLKPIASIVALIVVYALALLDRTPSGELATRALLYAWLFVAIPAVVSLAVNLASAPAPARLAMSALAARLREAAAALATPRPRPGVRRARPRPHGPDPHAPLALARIEHWPDAGTLDALAAAAEAQSTLSLLVAAIDQEASIPEAWRRAAAARLAQMADGFARGDCPCEVEPPAVPASVPLTPRARALVARFGAVLAAFPGARSAPAERERTPFLAADAWRNPAYLQYALKTTAAAMACYLFYVLLDWPGIHTSLITCYIVALPTTAETVEKLTLRIVGCVAGAVAGLAALVWLVPAIDSLGALLSIVFIGAFAGGWIAAGDPRIAYAGFQFAFAFFLCVVQGDGPAFDLTIARDRVIGILVGDAAIYLAFAVLWPVRIGPRIDAAFHALREQVLRLTRLPVASRRHELGAFEARLAAIEGDLALRHFERPHEGASQAWHAVRRRALGAAEKLKPIVFLEEDPRILQAVADRLDPRPAPPLAPSAASPSAPQSLPQSALQRRAAGLASVLEKSRAESR